jgi:predicted ferric reductase
MHATTSERIYTLDVYSIPENLHASDGVLTCKVSVDECLHPYRRLHACVLVVYILACTHASIHRMSAYMHARSVYFLVRVYVCACVQVCVCVCVCVECVCVCVCVV